jgi:hypothetical protein
MIDAADEGGIFMSALSLVGKYRIYWRQTRPVASTLGAFATLNGASASQDATQPPLKQSSQRML